VRTNRLQIWKWSFSDVRELIDNFRPHFAFQHWNRGSFWNKKLKKHSSDRARCQKVVGGIYFTKKWRAETLQPGLEFDDFKHWLKVISSNASPGWTVHFLGGDDRCFLKEGVKTYLMAPVSPLNSPTFFCLYICSLCQKQRVLLKTWYTPKVQQSTNTWLPKNNPLRHLGCDDAWWEHRSYIHENNGPLMSFCSEPKTRRGWCRCRVKGFACDRASSE
jgi:hypothetical protein